MKAIWLGWQAMPDRTLIGWQTQTLPLEAEKSSTTDDDSSLVLLQHTTDRVPNYLHCRLSLPSAKTIDRDTFWKTTKNGRALCFHLMLWHNWTDTINLCTIHLLFYFYYSFTFFLLLKEKSGVRYTLFLLASFVDETAVIMAK